ncbi:MAG: hypothetical protein HY516_01990 [Candidatus Aenigmarchaeota archaeon]|nr:hypothetical protein [Candidatus Aenigmarchaeota archaeon]
MNVDKSIDVAVLKILRGSENPVSTREIAIKINRAWHSVNTHCMQLQLEGKLERLKISNLNLWRIKK